MSPLHRTSRRRFINGDFCLVASRENHADPPPQGLTAVQLTCYQNLMKVRTHPAVSVIGSVPLRCLVNSSAQLAESEDWLQTDANPPVGAMFLPVFVPFLQMNWLAEILWCIFCRGSPVRSGSFHGLSPKEA